MNESQKDLHKIERQLSERIHTVQLEAIKMANRARNEAIGAFGVFLIILSILSFFQLKDFVATKIDDTGGKEIESLLDDSRNATTSIGKERERAKELVGKLEEGGFVKTDELQDYLSGTKTQLSQLELRTERYLDERIWKDKSKDRKENIPYHNNTGFPLEIVVSISPVGSGPEHCDLRLYINNMLVVKHGTLHGVRRGYRLGRVPFENRNSCTGTVTVPPDAKYKMRTRFPESVSIKWFELW